MPESSGTRHRRAAERAGKLRHTRAARVMMSIILLAGMFAGGFVLRGNPDLMKYLGIPEVNWNGIVKSEEPAQKEQDIVSLRVAEIEELLRNESMDGYDGDAITSPTVAALVDATGNTDLHYYDAERYAKYTEENSKSAPAGIGVLFAEYNGQAYALDVFAGSVAEAKGVREGDFVVSIDGDDSQTWTAAEASKAMARDEDATVVVTWRRPSSLDASDGEQFTTTLTCAKHSKANVETQLTRKVGYISLRQITSNSADLISAAVKKLDGDGAQAFVLDLRGCPGGYLTQAVDIASLFMKSGVVVKIQTKNDLASKSASGNVVTERPLVVLVDKHTAAAAEVLAAALQDTKRATVVGSTTMGKGSVQVMRELTFGGALRYTAAYYISPSDHAINGSGVSPDVKVDAGANATTVKNLAIETAASKIEK